MALDEENLDQAFPNHDPDRALEVTAESTESAMLMHRGPSRQQSHGRSGTQGAASRSNTRPRWMQDSRRDLENEEADDEVPASLLVEGGAHQAPSSDEQPPRGPGRPFRPFPVPPVPGPSTREARAQWKATQVQQRLYHDEHGSQARRARISNGALGLAVADPKEKALWRWANVENLDNFLKDVYDYFLGNGIWSIMLSRVLNLL